MLISEMDSNEIVHDFTPLFLVYKDGRVERLKGNETVPPSTDPQTGVQSKDILISPETDVSARLFIPKITNADQKLPLLIYIHGGAFSIESPFSPLYHNYLTSLVAEANVVAVSIHYRRAPEHPLPIAYDDTWAAVNWVTSHSINGQGTEPWLKDHADFGRVFLAGDSAGANIAHNMAVRAGVAELPGGVNFLGMIAVHPFFGNDQVDKLWMFLCPSSSGCDDPRLNPAADPRVKSLGCTRVLVLIAGKDWLRDRGLSYYETLKKCGCDGQVEMEEAEGEDHVFHLFNPDCEKAATMMKRVVMFLNQLL